MEVRAISGSRALSYHEPRLMTQLRNEPVTQSSVSANEGEVGTKMAMNSS